MFRILCQKEKFGWEKEIWEMPFYSLKLRYRNTLIIQRYVRCSLWRSQKGAAALGLRPKPRGGFATTM